MKTIQCGWCGKYVNAMKIASTRRKMINHLIKEHPDKVDEKGNIKLK